MWLSPVTWEAKQLGFSPDPLAIQCVVKMVPHDVAILKL